MHTPTSGSPTDRIIRLPDGRQLGYAEYGDPAGVPALFFHGAPGSRLSAALLASAATSRRVRLIGVDRPGFGLSSPQPERGRTEWPADIEKFADALGLGRFAVLGWSAGGPFALSCAALIPHRLTMVGVLAGVGRAAKFDPTVIRALIGGIRIDPDPNRLADRLSKAWTRTRTAAGTGVEVAQEAAGLVAAGIREGLRENPTVLWQELRLMSRAWEFDPGTVTGVPVRFWHGKADAVIPASQSRTLAALIPRAQATFYPGAGHVSLLTAHGGEILDEVRRLAHS